MSALGTNRLLSATSRSYYVSTSMVPPRAETVKPINAMFPQFGDVTRIWPLSKDCCNALHNLASAVPRQLRKCKASIVFGLQSEWA